jgi:hypothetical protein
MIVNTYTNFLSHEVQEKINYLMNVAQQDPNNRMPNNYSTKKLALNDTLAVSIAERDGIPFGYSSLMHRQIYKNTARIISRFYYHPLHEIRGLKTAELPSIKFLWREHTVRMIEDQTKLAYDLGYDGVFISQHDKTLRLFTRMYNGLSKRSSIKDWNFDPNKKYRVCGGEDCEHWVISHGELQLKEVI